jgi:signal transduction histidine kinase
LAEWLAARAPESLAAEPTPVPADQAARWGMRAYASVLVGEVYQALESMADRTTRAHCVVAMLHNAVDWITPAAGEPATSRLACLPDWIADWSSSAAGPQIRRAVQIAQSSGNAADTEVDLAGCRQRAEQARAEWLAPGEWPDDRLSSLGGKLAKLSELECRFAESLQREKLDSLAEFAAGAGHEINNPLAVIAGRAQLFLHEEKDPERRRGLALINAQAMRVYEMIADLRLFARPPEPERRSVELVGLVDRVLEELGPRAAEQDTSLARTGGGGPLSANVDPVQLTVALKALVANSMEALGAGGRVEVDLGRHGVETQIRVIDDGPGIAAGDLSRVFDPFFSARQAGRGLGMGLAKCWRIVTNHGGRIDVSSQPGHGATFTIRLPL